MDYEGVFAGKENHWQNVHADKQEEALIKLKDKYGERYEYSKETILFDTIEEIQKILDL